MPASSRSMPNRFRVTASDLVVFLSRFAKDIVFRSVIVMDGRVDELLLRRAARLSLDAPLASDPSYRPKPKLRGDHSLRQVLRRPPLGRMVRGLSANGMPFDSDPCWALGLPPGGERPAVLVKRALPPERFAAIRAYARAHDATINDVLLAAWCRAMHRLIQPPAGTFLSVPIHAMSS